MSALPNLQVNWVQHGAAVACPRVQPGESVMPHISLPVDKYDQKLSNNTIIYYYIHNRRLCVKMACLMIRE